MAVQLPLPTLLRGGSSGKHRHLYWKIVSVVGYRGRVFSLPRVCTETRKRGLLATTSPTRSLITAFSRPVTITLHKTFNLSALIKQNIWTIQLNSKKKILDSILDTRVSKQITVVLIIVFKYLLYL
jgi:hypothetical protein